MHILCPHCRNPIEVVKLTPREELSCPSCGSSFLLEGESTTAECIPERKLGKFELLDAVGQGAFGTVYKARDPELDRTVAIKIPRSGNLAGPQELDRFLREARSVAQLRHPSIVTVHEVGQTDGLSYLVSDFVEGVTLADLLTARRPGFREAAGLIASVAEALQYAHERGVVHRDVKPSNVMIGDDGKPCVMDFGLAKRDAGEITMTMEGQVLGTPAYMSPEQARGEGHTVDGRSDVYSLGVILYELLTGELPFRGNKRMLLHQVLHDDPRPPRSLNDHIPRDLETVCLKAMAKEPARRYATAQELADDLRRWLAGEPIRARAVGRFERALRWARRHPARAALVLVSGTAALTAVALAVGLAYHLQLNDAYQAEALARSEAESARLAEQEQRERAEGALRLAEAAKNKETEQRKRADRIGYLHSILLADQALREHRVVHALDRLNDSPEELRGWEWRHLNAQCHAELFSFPGDMGSVLSGGAFVVVREGSFGPTRSGREQATRVYDARTGKEVLALKGEMRVAFSPARSHVLASSPSTDRGGDGVARVYDLRTGQEVLAIKAPAGLFDASFSADATRIRGVDRDGVIRVFDAGKGEEIFAVKGLKWDLSGMFSPDGSRLKGLDPDGNLRLYDAGTGKEALTIKPPVGFSWARFSRDGLRIEGVDRDGTARVYDARTGEERLALKAPAAFAGWVFSPDGRRLAISTRERNGGEGAARVFDARTGKEVSTLKTPTSSGEVMFSPDGSRIAFRGPVVLTGETGVRIFDVRTGQEVFATKGIAGGSRGVFSPDGTLMALTPVQVGGGDGLVRVYDTRSGEEVLVLRGPGKLGMPWFSPDGAHITARLEAGEVRALVYDVRAASGGVPLPLPKLSGQLVLSPDGSRLATGGSFGPVRLYDTRTGQELLTLNGQDLDYPVFSPDGTRIAISTRTASTRNQLLRVFDARTGQGVLAFKVPPRARFFRFNPDGARLVTSDEDGVVRVYDAGTGEETLSIKAPEQLLSPVFSPDGTRIAAANWNRGRRPSSTAPGEQLIGLRVFDAMSGKEVAALKAPLPLWGATFSPDGTRIAAPADDGTIRVFDMHGSEAALTIRGPVKLSGAVFSPDGARIMADPVRTTMGGGDGAVRLFDARTGHETCVLKGPAPLGHAAFSPDGSEIIVLPEYDLGDGIVRVFEAPTDIPPWQAQRRQALADGLPGWHRRQAAEYEREGMWFAAAFHLGRLTRLEPGDGTHYLRRGQALVAHGTGAEAQADFEKAITLKETLSEAEQADAHAALGQFKEAANLYARAVESPDAPAEVWRRHVLLKLHLGGRDDYAAACAAMVQRLEGRRWPRSPLTVAWACALAPQGLADFKSVIEPARNAVHPDPNPRGPGGFGSGSLTPPKPKDASEWRILGAILHRAGRHQEAITELNEAVRRSSEGGAALDFLFLAMAHHHLNQPDEAKRWLARAAEAAEKAPPLSWEERLEFQLLRGEAGSLVQKKAQP